MSSILVVGSLIVDIAATVNHFPVTGETVLVDNVRFGPGGKGNNQATAARRAGAGVVMVARLGDDALGGIMADHIAAEGMDRRYVAVVPGLPTGCALIEVEEGSGDNRIIVVKGANAALTEEDVHAAEADFAACDVVLTQLEVEPGAVLAARALAKKYGKPFVLNPAPFQQVPPGLFEGVDILIPNETEAAFFSGRPVGDAAGAAAVLRDQGVGCVIVTLGGQGAYLDDGGHRALIPAVPVRPVDTTGAGDAFCGAFCVALAEGRGVEEAIRFAHCAAALSVTRVGTSPAMPYRREIDDLFSKTYTQEDPA